MSTFKDDRCTDILLDELIAPTESRGNYNAVIGEIDATDDLSAYTLGKIKTVLMPSLLIRHPRLNSTATGRYQIIRRTLTIIQGKLNLPDTVLFTPAIQDRMAWQLMIGRGYPAWWAVRMTDAEFLYGLSCEWASIPDPYAGGRSHFDGIGPNHAGASLQHEYAILSRARAAKPQFRK